MEVDRTIAASSDIKRVSVETRRGFSRRSSDTAPAIGRMEPGIDLHCRKTLTDSQPTCGETRVPSAGERAQAGGRNGPKAGRSRGPVRPVWQEGHWGAYGGVLGVAGSSAAAYTRIRVVLPACRFLRACCGGVPAAVRRTAAFALRGPHPQRMLGCQPPDSATASLAGYPVGARSERMQGTARLNDTRLSRWL